MPYAVFFRGGYAIHATGAVGRLGRAGVAWLRASRPGQRRQALLAGPADTARAIPGSSSPVRHSTAGHGVTYEFAAGSILSARRPRCRRLLRGRRLSGRRRMPNWPPDARGQSRSSRGRRDTSEAPGAQVVARIDLSDQKMHIYVGEKLAHVFPVSTGPQRLRHAGRPLSGRVDAPKWRSRKYQMAPMPWSVFFHGGYAVHGTTDLRRLGRPASHGCVRLDPKNAKIFY